MKTTVIVRNMSEQFWEGSGARIKGCDSMKPDELYSHLSKVSRDLPKNITFKHGSGQFRDRVDWNGIMKAGKPLSVIKERRRGYILLTFLESKP